MSKSLGARAAYRNKLVLAESVLCCAEALLFMWIWYPKLARKLLSPIHLYEILIIEEGNEYVELQGPLETIEFIRRLIRGSWCLGHMKLAWKAYTAPDGNILHGWLSIMANSLLGLFRFMDLMAPVWYLLFGGLERRYYPQIRELHPLKMWLAGSVFAILSNGIDLWMAFRVEQQSRKDHEPEHSLESEKSRKIGALVMRILISVLDVAFCLFNKTKRWRPNRRSGTMMLLRGIVTGYAEWTGRKPHDFEATWGVMQYVMLSSLISAICILLGAHAYACGHHQHF